MLPGHFCIDMLGVRTFEHLNEFLNMLTPVFEDVTSVLEIVLLYLLFVTRFDWKFCLIDISCCVNLWKS